MKITTTSYAVFACHSAACAPPPAGKGGSTPSSGGSFKNVHHARATHRKLAAKANRTPEEEARMKEALVVVRANDAAYGRRMAAARGKQGRDTGRGDDGYDAMKDAYVTGESNRPVTDRQRRAAYGAGSTWRTDRRDYGGM